MAVPVRRRRPLHLLRTRLVTRIAYVVAAMCLIQYYSLHHSYLEALAEKYSPTIFDTLSRQEQQDISASPLWQLNVESEQEEPRKRLLENRPHWKKLGSGYEGDTFTFNGSAIKIFKPSRSPLRNCVPESDPPAPWPPEIPVSLLLGGHKESQAISPTVSHQPSFLPVQDYFFLLTGDRKWPGEWHLVTPFLSQGTMEQAAKRLREHTPSRTAEQIDARFRQSLNRLLDALGGMHSHYGLCHDDIKMENIFVEDFIPVSSSAETHSDDENRDAHWLLADLGNARQISHSYHTSLLWTHDNGQHPDCRINDVLRLMRTYTQFLQSATMSSETQARAFNDAFLAGTTPWSQLYWYTVTRGHFGGATMAQEVRGLSATAFGPTNTETFLPKSKEEAEGQQRLMKRGLRTSWVSRWLSIDESSSKALAVRRELHHGMMVSEKWAKIFGTMGVLKTPSQSC